MLDIILNPGESRRAWYVVVNVPIIGDTVSLPPTEDWHEAVKLLNMLAGIYGEENVSFYQIDVTSLRPEPHD